MVFNLGDVFLQTRAAGLVTLQLLPFVHLDYAIYFKINDFELSSTFFIDGLSIELWKFILLGFLLILLAFLISAFFFHRYLKHRTSLGFLFIYQANFWCTQNGARTNLDRYLSWKIQKLIGVFFNCIVMTAFAAKFIGLMSVRHHTQPFQSLEDFARIRSHTLCIEENLFPLDFFIKKGLNSLVSLKREPIIALSINFYFIISEAKISTDLSGSACSINRFVRKWLETFTMVFAATTTSL